MSMKQQTKEFCQTKGQGWQETDEGIERQLLGYNDQLMMARIRFKKGAVGTLHDHPHVQASYVASGRFKVTINDKVSILSAGDAFFVPSGDRKSTRLNSSHSCASR